MEVKVVSVEKVKPACLTKKRLGENADDQLTKPPFKLCLLDQLMSRAYFGIILFYQTPSTSSKTMQNNNDDDDIARRLKASLSTALSTFYPLAGRVKGNATVDDFQAGVPFVESRVKGCASVSEFLKQPNLELLNNFFPVEPFCLLTAHGQDMSPPPPPLLVQVSTFDCGGLAVGLSFYHKVSDGATADAFLKTWVAAANAAAAQDQDGDSIVLSQAGSSVFPPRESIPSEVERLGDLIFLDKGTRTATRRFVFDFRSIASLKSRIATGAGGFENPTTTEAISTFLWESIMRAAAETSAPVAPPPQFLIQAVNLRPRIINDDDGRLLSDDIAIGNLFTTGMAFCDSHDDIVVKTTRSDLARLIRAGVARVVDGADEFVKTVSGDDGFEVLVEGLKRYGEMSQREEVLTCSSWARFCFADVDFGWGQPAWTALLGDASGDYPPTANLIILKGLAPRDYKNIEAWIRLEEKVMTTLELDPCFLQFASPNPPVLLSD